MLTSLPSKTAPSTDSPGILQMYLWCWKTKESVPVTPERVTCTTSSLPWCFSGVTYAKAPEKGAETGRNCMKTFQRTDQCDMNMKRMCTAAVTARKKHGQKPGRNFEGRELPSSSSSREAPVRGLISSSSATALRLIPATSSSSPSEPSSARSPRCISRPVSSASSASPPGGSSASSTKVSLPSSHVPGSSAAFSNRCARASALFRILSSLSLVCS
mmetsp:Transcript_35258/g.99808  ORF Transcript_35258/g.99808 Transcript_35258/m.99808 type:complete len:216 (-) Transcript_35258:226-873(-)